MTATELLDHLDKYVAGVEQGARNERRASDAGTRQAIEASAVGRSCRLFRAEIDRLLEQERKGGRS